MWHCKELKGKHLLYFKCSDEIFGYSTNAHKYTAISSKWLSAKVFFVYTCVFEKRIW